jgi:RNA polymerase sigma-70 factor (ECF subfamily)
VGGEQALGAVLSVTKGEAGRMPERIRGHTLYEVPDEALMARYADGDPEAFEQLFRRYESRVYAFFVRRTGSPERAQDLYQELFLRIHRARDRFDAERLFAPWLFRIAHRLLVDDGRLAHRSHEVPLEEREPRAECASSEESLGVRELLGRALSTLSREEQHILVSSKLEGVGYPELAAQLGKSPEAVRKLASRALQRLHTGPLLASARSEGG